VDLVTQMIEEQNPWGFHMNYSWKTNIIKCILNAFELAKMMNNSDKWTKGSIINVKDELERLEIKTDKAIYKLSAGQSVLVRTLIALTTDSKMILIDEPFENVDVAKRRMIVNWLK